jgi:hypothetical protein
VVLLDRAKDFVAAHAPASAAAGVAAAVVVGGGVFVITDDPEPATAPPEAAGQERPGSGKQKTPSQGRDRKARPERRTSVPDRTGVKAPSSTTSSGTVGPAPATGPGPDDDSAPEPTDGAQQPGPGDTPPNDEPPAETPPTADLRVTASASSQTGAVHRVVVVVFGLAPGGSATLSVAGRGVTVVLTDDRRCDSPHPQACRVTSGPSTYAFTAVAAPGSDASVAFTVSPDDGTADADGSNNRATVRLGS